MLCEEIHQQRNGVLDRNKEGLYISLTAFWLRIYFWNFTLDWYLSAHSIFHLLYKKAWILSLNIAILSGGLNQNLCALSLACISWGCRTGQPSSLNWVSGFEMFGRF